MATTQVRPAETAPAPIEPDPRQVRHRRRRRSTALVLVTAALTAIVVLWVQPGGELVIDGGGVPSRPNASVGAIPGQPNEVTVASAELVNHGERPIEVISWQPLPSDSVEVLGVRATRSDVTHGVTRGFLPDEQIRSSVENPPFADLAGATVPAVGREDPTTGTGLLLHIGYRLRPGHTSGAIDGIRVTHTTGRFWPRRAEVDVYAGVTFCAGAPSTVLPVLASPTWPC